MSDLFISKYIEGSSYNKALEFYNPTDNAINLGTGNYIVEIYFNGSDSPGFLLNLTGTIASGSAYIVAHSSANFITANGGSLTPHQTDARTNWFNGDDAIVLKKGGASGEILDAIGQIGYDPGGQWGSGNTSTQDNTIQRKENVIAGDTNPNDTFDPSLEWDGFAKDDFSGLGTHQSLLPIPNRVITDTTSETATNDGSIGLEEYAGFSIGINNGAGGVIGRGSQLYLDSDTSGNLNLGLVTAPGTQLGGSDAIVVYIDSIAGGFADTKSFNDFADSYRSAISASTSQLTFATEFEADYAIAFNADGTFSGGLWQLAAGGNNAHNVVTTLTRTQGIQNSSEVWEFSGFDLSDFGLTPGDSFRYVATYLNLSGERSNEFHGVSLATVTGDNPGNDDVTLGTGDFNEFESIPQPEFDYTLTVSTDTVVEGNSGRQTLTFTVTRSGDTDEASQIEFSLGGTATFGSDYDNLGGTGGAMESAGTIDFAPGDREKTITLEILGDVSWEADETIALTLSETTASGTNPISVTLLNDDLPPTPSIPTIPETPVSEDNEPNSTDTESSPTLEQLIPPSENSLSNINNSNTSNSATPNPPPPANPNGDTDDFWVGNAQLNILWGWGGNDTLVGYGGDDRLEGHEGDDLLFGNQESDRLNGGNGEDTLFGGKNNDTLHGGRDDDVLVGNIGNDWLDGEDGNDVIFGNVGADVIWGNTGHDILYGGKDNDTLVSGLGNDVLSGDYGNDVLTGGDGGDRFDFSPGEGTNLITDFTDGQDLIGLRDGLTFENLTIVQQGEDVLISYIQDSDTQMTQTTLSITLQGVMKGAIDAADFARV